MTAFRPLLATAVGRRELAAFYRQQLLENTLAFWFPRAIDEECGGYLHCFDRDGSLVDSDKSVWAQGRMSWLLLSLHNSLAHNTQWLAWGQHGLAFLNQHAFDEDGRMFFHLSRSGEPIRKRRYAYSESFAAIAYAADFRATGNPASARRARHLFDFFTHWNFSPDQMPPKFTGQRPLIAMAPRMIALVTAQELRDNLGDDPHFTTWIDRCINEIRRYFVKPDLKAVMEVVAPNGDVSDHFDGRLLNPGHAIEGAWFIMREGQQRGDADFVRLGCEMLAWMWERGWDQQCGGLFYYRDLYDRPIQEYWHDMKFWWPHDEALIATMFAYLLTGDEKYAHWHQQVHEWSYRHFADAEFGEWFGYLHRDGQVSSTLKGNLWKSCFHHPRAQWQCFRLLVELA